MRLSVVLLAVAVAGVLGGAALIGLPALGAAVIFESLCLGAWAVARDDGRDPRQQRPQHAVQPRKGERLYAVPSVTEQLWERARAS